MTASGRCCLTASRTDNVGEAISNAVPTIMLEVSVELFTVCRK
jgi:hypothetical protein